MKHYKDVVVPEHTQSKISHTTCDICGEVVKLVLHDENFKVDFINAERETGTVYPEGGSLERTTFDICFSCFDKVCEFIKDKGVTHLKKEEIDV